MVNAKPDTLDTPATPDRRRGVRTSVALIALDISGYLIGHALLPLLRLWFDPAAHGSPHHRPSDVICTRARRGGSSWTRRGRVRNGSRYSRLRRHPILTSR
jgi:hypothetical protein